MACGILLLAAGRSEAAEYVAADAPASLSDANGTVAFEYDESGDVSKLEFTPNDGATLVLSGDSLPFAADATILPGGQHNDLGGRAVISNAFTTAGALQFVGMTNMSWYVKEGLPSNTYATVLENVSLDQVVPVSSTPTSIRAMNTYTYTSYNIVREADTLRCEMQALAGVHVKGVYMELKQDGSDIVGRVLAAGYFRNAPEKLGNAMFTYVNGVVVKATGVTGYGLYASDNNISDQNSYGIQQLTIGPRSGAASKLTFAASGTVDLPAVSGSGVEVTFDANAFGGQADAFQSRTLRCGTQWVSLTTEHELKDITIRSGRIGGSYIEGSNPDGLAAIAFGWTNNNTIAGCQLQQFSGNLIRTIDVELRQNGGTVEIRWVRTIYTYTNASEYYGRKILTVSDPGVTSNRTSSQIALLWVSTRYPPVIVNANGANTMTGSAYVIKGDDMHPITFKYANGALPEGSTDCYGNAELYTHESQSTSGWTCDGKSAITMHQGARLYQAGYVALGISTTKQYVSLDASTLHAQWNNSLWSYCNYLTLSNGSSVVGGTFHVGYNSDSYWRVRGIGASVSDAGIYLVGNGGNLREVTIDVDDTVVGDGADFIFNGNIEKENGGNHYKSAFKKTGEGTMLMNGTLAYTNYPTRIVAGTLALGRSGVTVAEHKFSLDGGTLALAAGTTNEAATLAVTASSSLSFGTGSALVLADLLVQDGATLSLEGDVPRNGLKVTQRLDEPTLARIMMDGSRAMQTGDGYIRRASGITIMIR